MSKTAYPLAVLAALLCWCAVSCHGLGIKSPTTAPTAQGAAPPTAAAPKPAGAAPAPAVAAAPAGTAAPAAPGASAASPDTAPATTQPTVTPQAALVIVANAYGFAAGVGVLVFFLLVLVAFLIKG